MIETRCCRQRAFVTDASDPHTTVTCTDDCTQCTEDHHHGKNGIAMGVGCRPIDITALPGSVTMSLATPGSV